MKRTCGLALVTLCLIVATADAIRAPSPRRLRVAALTGQTWAGPDGTLGVVRYVFEPNGILSYSYPNGRTFRNGTWQLSGDRLTFEVNRFRRFRGTVNGDIIRGDSWNDGGEAWTTSLRYVGGRR